MRSVHDLVDAIVFPNASFVPGHEVFRVETEGAVHTGVIADRTAETILLISGPNDERLLRRSDIQSMKPSRVSLMPEGFDQTLSEEELKDLFAYLRSQTSRETALPGNN